MWRHDNTEITEQEASRPARQLTHKKEPRFPWDNRYKFLSQVRQHRDINTKLMKAPISLRRRVHSLRQKPCPFTLIYHFDRYESSRLRSDLDSRIKRSSPPKRKPLESTRQAAIRVFIDEAEQRSARVLPRRSHLVLPKRHPWLCENSRTEAPKLLKGHADPLPFHPARAFVHMCMKHHPHVSVVLDVPVGALVGTEQFIRRGHG